MRSVRFLAACGLSLFLVFALVSMAEAGYWKFVEIKSDKSYDNEHGDGWADKYQAGGNSVLYSSSFRGKLTCQSQSTWSSPPEVLVPGQTYTMTAEVKPIVAGVWMVPDGDICRDNNLTILLALNLTKEPRGYSLSAFRPTDRKAVIKFTPLEGAIENNLFNIDVYYPGRSVGPRYVYEWIDGNPPTQVAGTSQGRGINETIASPAVSFTSPTIDLHNITHLFGWQFSVNNNITINALGFYDNPAYGLSESHAVGIYNASNGTLVVSGVVNPASTYSDWFNWTNVTPTVLVAGQTYDIVAVSVNDNRTWDPNSFTVDPSINYIRDVWSNGVELLALPNSTDSYSNGYFGPNFAIAPPAAPVPTKNYGRMMTSQQGGDYSSKPLSNVSEDMTRRGQYLGCFKDQEDRDLNGAYIKTSKMTTELCISLCGQMGFSYAGTQYSHDCFCGNSYGKLGNANNCDAKCDGNTNQICGGLWANSVYRVGSD